MKLWDRISVSFSLFYPNFQQHVRELESSLSASLSAIRTTEFRSERGWIAVPVLAFMKPALAVARIAKRGNYFLLEKRCYDVMSASVNNKRCLEIIGKMFHRFYLISSLLFSENYKCRFGRC